MHMRVSTHAHNTLSTDNTDVQVFYPFHPLHGVPCGSFADRSGEMGHGRTIPLGDIAALQQTTPHSITSSARESSEGGTVRPRALAVLRLITNSYLTFCSIGRSTTLAPLRTRPA
jgi:hypothetical protein